MEITPYQERHHTACLAIFDSNCPFYFDPRERALFDNWLNHLEGKGGAHSQPAMVPVQRMQYSVILEGDAVVACGGYYVPQDEQEGRLAWGMVHANHHNRGYGKALFYHRVHEIQSHWPGHAITLGTSQHTQPYYAKRGMVVVNHIPHGYGPTLDRYDMVYKPANTVIQPILPLP